jgi:hypothetical protein
MSEEKPCRFVGLQLVSAAAPDLQLVSAVCAEIVPILSLRARLLFIPDYSNKFNVMLNARRFILYI